VLWAWRTSGASSAGVGRVTLARFSVLPSSPRFSKKREAARSLVIKWWRVKLGNNFTSMLFDYTYTIVGVWLVYCIEKFRVKYYHGNFVISQINTEILHPRTLTCFALLVLSSPRFWGKERLLAVYLITSTKFCQLFRLEEIPRGPDFEYQSTAPVPPNKNRKCSSSHKLVILFVVIVYSCYCFRARCIVSVVCSTVLSKGSEPFMWDLTTAATWPIRIITFVLLTVSDPLSKSQFSLHISIHLIYF